jgi:hypothetical protein
MTDTPSAEELAAMHPELKPPTWRKRLEQGFTVAVTSFMAAVFTCAFLAMAGAVVFLSTWAIIASWRGITR